MAVSLLLLAAGRSLAQEAECGVDPESCQQALSDEETSLLALTRDAADVAFPPKGPSKRNSSPNRPSGGYGFRPPSYYDALRRAAAQRGGAGLTTTTTTTIPRATKCPSSKQHPGWDTQGEMIEAKRAGSAAQCCMFCYETRTACKHFTFYSNGRCELKNGKVEWAQHSAAIGGWYTYES